MKLGKMTLVFTLALAVSAGIADAEDGESLFGMDTASVTYGPYVRAELGIATPNEGDGFWLPPGPSDPRINFGVDMESGAFGGLAFGYDWQNGFRGELSLNVFGDSDLTAPCISASDATPCSTHADISSASVQTTAAMANLYYAPREARGNNSRIQPFFTVGLGLAKNDMSDWTRTNPGATQPVRTFAGASETEMAWSVGGGIAIELERKSDWPIIFEATYRYYDLGTARGGATPLPGSGSSEPIAPFQFKNRSQVVSVGLRIPLERK